MPDPSSLMNMVECMKSQTRYETTLYEKIWLVGGDRLRKIFLSEYAPDSRVVFVSGVCPVIISKDSKKKVSFLPLKIRGLCLLHLSTLR